VVGEGKGERNPRKEEGAVRRRGDLQFAVSDAAAAGV
jgi:hypothetical protein